MKLQPNENIAKRMVQRLRSRSIFVAAVIHVIRLFISAEYRKKRPTIICASDAFLYKYGRTTAYLLWPVLFFIAKVLSKKNIYISVHNIVAVGHLYPEIDLLKRYLSTGRLPANSYILFVQPKSELLVGIKELFDDEHVLIIASGALHLLFQLTAILRPEISVNVSQSSLNYVAKKNDLSVHDVFMGRQYERAVFISSQPDNFPLRKYGDSYRGAFVHQKLGIRDRYVVIQIKDKAVNATFQPVDPHTYLPALGWIKSRGYDIVFAGREKLPDCFSHLNIYNYSESAYANPINDYMLVFNASFVLGSASGFVMIAELLNIPLLSINSWQHVSYVGRKTILIPTLLEKEGMTLSFEDQRKYAFSTMPTGDDNLPLDKGNYKALDASANDILQGLIELTERMRHNDWGYTALQRKVKVLSPRTMLGVGLSRISNDFLVKNKIFFCD